MIETETGYQHRDEIARADVAAVYVGLNDFSISRSGTPLFQPLVDGTVENIVQSSRVPVGVGGVTDPHAGWPIKSRDIIQEYQRLGVQFSILRRSFEEAIKSEPMEKVITRIKDAYRHASLRDEHKTKADFNLFELSIYNKEERA
jgi:2-keto-3-deoxy-L-rhamnonate aldolase RhmA